MVERWMGWLASIVWAAALAACGGGEPVGDARSASAAREKTQAVAPLSVDALLDWAERAYPQYFPGQQVTLSSAPYEYRHYPQTGNYVGVAGEDVYVLGPISNQQLQRVGRREDFRCQVQPQDCEPRYARAGWTAQLSTLSHGVAGTVTIVDSRTLRISGFRYDGLAPLVFGYIGAENNFSAFAAGKAIGAEFAHRAYTGETVELQLPAGQSLDGFNAISIWCVQFRVNFGSGSFAPPPAAPQ